MRDSNYKKDIHEISVSRSALIDQTIIDASKFKGVPKAFYYNLIRRTHENNELFKRLNATRLHWVLIQYYNIPLVMITEPPEKWTITACIKINKKFSTGNPKAVFVNKHHTVWNIALFYVPDLEDLTREKFINTFLSNAEITGRKSINYMAIIDKDKRKLHNIGKKKLLHYLVKNTDIRDVLQINDDVSIFDMSFGELKNVVLEHIRSVTTKELNRLTISEMVYKYSISRDNYVDDKKRLIQQLINEKWNRFDIPPDEKSIIPSRTVADRRKIALSYLGYLTEEYFVTLEDAYLNYGSKLATIYVEDAEPFYESSINFHGIQEFDSMILNLSYGVSHKSGKTEKERTDYMYIPSNKLIMSSEHANNNRLFLLELKKKNT